MMEFQYPGCSFTLISHFISVLGSSNLTDYRWSFCKLTNWEYALIGTVAGIAFTLRNPPFLNIPASALRDKLSGVNSFWGNVNEPQMVNF